MLLTTHAIEFLDIFIIQYREQSGRKIKQLDSYDLLLLSIYYTGLSAKFVFDNWTTLSGYFFVREHLI